MRLVAANLGSDVTFYYQNGDLFWGHTIELRLDAADNFIHADIPG